MVRVRRLAADKRSGGGKGMGRYRCYNDACGWEGLIQRHPLAEGGGAGDASTPAPRHRSSAPAQKATKASRTQSALAKPVILACVLLAAAAAAIGIAQVTGLMTARKSASSADLPQGRSFDGHALPADHPMLAWADDPESSHRPMPGLAAVATAASAASSAAGASSVVAAASAHAAAKSSGLALRQLCAWGEPGRNPYKGTVEQALTAARLPPGIVKQIATQVRAHANTDRLVISNRGIRADKGGREFDPRAIVMSYGHTLCLATRVNFKAGHEERADLYQVADAAGKRYSVMVPDVCGNVSVLAERGQALPVQVLAAAQAVAEASSARGGSGAGGGIGAGGGGSSSATPAGDGSFSVPETGTLACVALGVGLLGWMRRRRA